MQEHGNVSFCACTASCEASSALTGQWCAHTEDDCLVQTSCAKQEQAAQAATSLTSIDKGLGCPEMPVLVSGVMALLPDGRVIQSVDGCKAGKAGVVCPPVDKREVMSSPSSVELHMPRTSSKFAMEAWQGQSGIHNQLTQQNGALRTIQNFKMCCCGISAVFAGPPRLPITIRITAQNHLTAE